MREIRSQFESAGEGASGVGNLRASSVRCVPRGTRVGRFFYPCTVGNHLISLHFSQEPYGFESRWGRHGAQAPPIPIGKSDSLARGVMVADGHRASKRTAAPVRNSEGVAHTSHTRFMGM
jgi:hypothetical protein